MIAREPLVHGVLSNLRDMKPLTVLIIVGTLYTYAIVKTKSLFEGPTHMKICDYQFAHRTCEFLAKLSE